MTTTTTPDPAVLGDLGVRDWAADAACLGADPALFFAPDSDTDAHRAARVLCRTCTVRLDCLDYAITTRQDAGIWGGMNERDRRRLARTRAKAA